MDERQKFNMEKYIVKKRFNICYPFQVFIKNQNQSFAGLVVKLTLFISILFKIISDVKLQDHQLLNTGLEVLYFYVLHN